MTDWIDVKEKIPGDGQRIRIKTFDRQDNPIEVDAVFHLYKIDENTTAWEWEIGKNHNTVGRPTHWMPLLEETKEER